MIDVSANSPQLPSFCLWSGYKNGYSDRLRSEAGEMSVENQPTIEDVLRQISDALKQQLEIVRDHQNVLTALYTVLEKSDPTFVARFRKELEDVRRRSSSTAAGPEIIQ
jgi:hypothetical protein